MFWLRSKVTGRWLLVEEDGTPHELMCRTDRAVVLRVLRWLRDWVRGPPTSSS